MILIVQENGFTPVTACHHMTKRSRMLDADAVRHGEQILATPRVD